MSMKGAPTVSQPTTDATPDVITERVRERYAAAARQVQGGAHASCGCGSACCGTEQDAVTGDLYADQEVAGLPEEAVLASLGCGNPTALAELRAGETVLDLGSGGGIDVLLSARRVGPTGFAYGLDMTDEMLALARENQAKAGATNVAFLRGRIEDIPLPADAVDVVISNCVINLSADKGRVLREAFRVLKPGGRFAVADVVADGPVPPELRRNMEAWVGCLAGALEVDEYERLLREAGFAEVSITITRRYTAAEAGLDPAALPTGWEAGDGKLASAFVARHEGGGRDCRTCADLRASGTAGGCLRRLLRGRLLRGVREGRRPRGALLGLATVAGPTGGHPRAGRERDLLDVQADGVNRPTGLGKHDAGLPRRAHVSLLWVGRGRQPRDHGADLLGDSLLQLLRDGHPHAHRPRVVGRDDHVGLRRRVPGFWHQRDLRRSLGGPVRGAGHHDRGIVPGGRLAGALVARHDSRGVLPHLGRARHRVGDGVL
jgi:SAM-dependent methyltransferase